MPRRCAIGGTDGLKQNIVFNNHIEAIQEHQVFEVEARLEVTATNFDDRESTHFQHDIASVGDQLVPLTSRIATHDG